MDFWKQASPEGSGPPPAAPSASPGPTGSPIPVLVGIAWIVGAAAIGFLAFLQLEYSGLGLPDSSEAGGLAIINGLSALITAYFGAMAILSPTPGRMVGGLVWAVLNVAYGAYQVSQGVTHPVFLFSLVAFGVAGVLAFVGWQQLRQSATA